MRLSRVLFTFSLAFAAGIFSASYFFSSLFLVLFLLWAGVVSFSVFWGKGSFPLLGVFFLGAALGVLSYANAASLPEPLQEPREVSFTGIIVAPPEVEEDGQEIVVEPEEEVAGRVLLFVSSFEKVGQGDKVRVTGELRSPQAFEEFDYPLFLAKEGISWVMFRPLLEVEEQGNPFFFQLREHFSFQVRTRLSPPESSLLSAMLLGDKAQLGEEFKEQLNRTGTRHITAISGMHVAILSGMLFAFLLGLGFQRRKSALLVLVFLVFFVVFTGAAASTVRAGVMGSAFLVGSIAGRRNASLRTLVLAAALMLLFNPLLLAHDVGFQLSFLAVLGILLFLPWLQHAFRRVRNPFGIRDVLFMSISAQVFALPLVLYHFGLLSFVSLAANLLIVPLLPLVLLLGVFFLLGSLLLPFLGGLLAFPAGLLLSYVAFAVTSLSQLPFAASTAEGFPLWLAVLLLAAPSFFAFRFQQERRFRFREETMIL